MPEAERKRLEYVVLPRRLPGLALLERYLPPPADNLLDAELASFAAAGDTVLDPWAGTGWTARRALARGLRVVAADPSPFAQMAAMAYLLAPDGPALDAAFGQLAASRRVEVPLRQHLEELYATHCAACRRPVVGDQFIWPRDGDAPGRKIYSCPSCDAAIGGPTERVAAVDEGDLAKLGINRPPGADEPIPEGETEEVLPPAPVGLTEPVGPGSDAPPLVEAPALGEPGGPPPPPSQAPDPPSGPTATRVDSPRFASTVHPEPLAAAAGEGARQAQHYVQLRERFPVLDQLEHLVDEILELYTPRNLYALQAIATKIESEIHDPGSAAAMRLALAACLLPASRLNGYPGRVASLRISGGHIRQPASRHQRETNVWRLFEAAYRDVRTALAAAGHERRQARFAADFEELGGVSAANVLWIRCRPAVVGEYLPPEGIDFILGAPAPPPSIDELSFEYLATSWILGREAAETLRLEPLFGTGERADAGGPAVLRHALASAAEALRPGGWCSLVIDGDDPDRYLAVALAGAAAGLDLVDVIHRESATSGDGVVLHFRRPSAEDRLRDAVQSRPLRLGAEAGHLTYPELAGAIGRAVADLLRDRGEPAGLTRIVCAVLAELASSGLLRRLATQRGANDGEPSDPSRLDAGNPTLLAELIREELWREDHPDVLRIGGDERPSWWLRSPELAEQPLADRVEWATYSILSTAGRLDEGGFLDRIYRLFPGLRAPDEELVRACLGAYARIGERGLLTTEEELAERIEDHARTVALLADYGHRLGLRVWIGRQLQDRVVDGAPLRARLADEERRAYLPLVVRAPADLLGETDVIWYVRGKLAFLFEVEWTAMLGEAVLRRGRQIPPGDSQARFIVFPGQRTQLVRAKLARSPWLRAEVERQNWHFLKWEHLATLAGRTGASLEWLEPVLGLDPLVERGGEQLTMFGE